MKFSARNNIKGIVKEINRGAVNSEVIVDIGNGNEIVSVITNSSADRLDLKVGSEVFTIVKASNVIIATE